MSIKQGWLSARWNETQEVNDRLLQRNVRSQALRDVKSGTVNEFFHADFGTTTPNGLDCKPWNADKIVEIRDPHICEEFQKVDEDERYKQLMSASGWVTLIIGPMKG